MKIAVSVFCVVLWILPEVSPQTSVAQDHVRWVESSLLEMNTVKVGMTRSDVEKVFAQMRGQTELTPIVTNENAVTVPSVPALSDDNLTALNTLTYAGTGGIVTAFVKTTQSLLVTSDFSVTSTTLAAITGLTITLPPVTANWGVSCDLVISQATVGLDKIGMKTPTNPPTFLTGAGSVGTLAPTPGAFTDVSSVTAQLITSFTPVSTVKYAVHLGGGIVGTSTSGSGTAFQVVMATFGPGDPVVVYAGSACWIY